MKETFPDRLQTAAATVAADLPEGARLALELRARVSQAGYVCDDVFADDDGWCFFVSSQQAPVFVLVQHTSVNGLPAWQATAQYEGGLSSVWSERNARDGLQLAMRVQAVLNAHPALRGSAGRSADRGHPT